MSKICRENMIEEEATEERLGRLSCEILFLSEEFVHVFDR